MASTAAIELSWYEDVADVIEWNGGQKFEVGTVSLEVWGKAIMGCTYHHHVLPTFTPVNRNLTLRDYRRGMNSHAYELKALRCKIRTLSRDHPEISEEALVLDDPDNPQLIDLSIRITFPVPLSTDGSYGQAVLEKILPYIDLLGTVHAIEILKEEEGR